MLKEERKLILVPKETPLNAIHLSGSRILPDNLEFYPQTNTLND